MVAHKSNPASAAYDVFECLSCKTELRLSGTPHPDAGTPKQTKD